MPETLDTIMKMYKMLTKNVTEILILVRESKIFSFNILCRHSTKFYFVKNKRSFDMLNFS